MSTHAITRQLFETMIQIKYLMEEVCEESFEEKVSSILQFQALSVISSTNNVTNNELAKNLHISASSAAQLTERLFKADLIERHQDEKDRRVVRLSVKPKGTQEVHDLKEKMLEKVQKVFSCLSEKDLQEFLRIHQVLLENLKNKQK